MRTVRVIRTDRTGHFRGVMEAPEFETYAWEKKQEVVVVNGIQVETFEDFMRAVDSVPVAEEPEVLFFPPMAGG